MSNVTVVTPYHGTQSFDMISSELDAALSEAWNTYNRSASVSVNGVRAQLDRFMDGWLLDNCPLNIVFGLPWITGQIEALTQAGRVCGTATAAPPPPLSAPPALPGGYTPPQNLIPSQTPPPMGSNQAGTSQNLPPVFNGGPSNIQATDTPGGLTIMPGQVYRLIMVTAPGRVDTGATYPLCSRSNPDACQPIQFTTVGEAVSYAQQHGETPLQVNNAEEAWSIVEGKAPINPEHILGQGGGSDWMLWAAGILAAVFVLPKVFKKRSA